MQRIDISLVSFVFLPWWFVRVNIPKVIHREIRPLLIWLRKVENCLCFYDRLTSGLTRPTQWAEMSIKLSGDFHQVFISLSASSFVRKRSALITYANADCCWMSSESNCFPSSVWYLSDDVENNQCLKWDMQFKEKVNINISDGRNLFEILGLNRHHEF